MPHFRGSSFWESSWVPSANLQGSGLEILDILNRVNHLPVMQVRRGLFSWGWFNLVYPVCFRISQFGLSQTSHCRLLQGSSAVPCKSTLSFFRQNLTHPRVPIGQAQLPKHFAPARQAWGGRSSGLQLCSNQPNCSLRQIRCCCWVGIWRFTWHIGGMPGMRFWQGYAPYGPEGMARPRGESPLPCFWSFLRMPWATRRMGMPWPGLVRDS